MGWGWFSERLGYRGYKGYIGNEGCDGRILFFLFESAWERGGYGGYIYHKGNKGYKGYIVLKCYKGVTAKTSPNEFCTYL